ncbi:uncharacterized protein K444DRAFT_537752, partial [Hyaloscypha bicolor E]
EAFYLILKERKPYLYKSRHNYIIRRSRGPDSRFLIATKVKAKEDSREEKNESQEILKEILSIITSMK